MSSVKWPTEYGSAMIKAIDEILSQTDNETVRMQWWQVQDFIRENTTTRQLEVDVQANLYLKATFEMPCDYDDTEYVGSDIIQELGEFVDVQLRQPDEDLFLSWGEDGSCKLASVYDAEVDSFIDRDAL